MQQPVEGFTPALCVAFSIIGLSVVLLMVLNPPPMSNGFPFRKILIGALFNAICITGVFAALFPRKCSKIFFKGKGNAASSQREVKGHHPNCEAFSTHVVRIRGHTLCAACTGLLAGGVSAMFLSTAYFTGFFSLGETALLLVLTGALGVIIVFLGQMAKGFTRLLLNLFFPIGSMLVLIGVDGLFENMFLDVFLNALIVFWILTRIMVSSWNHSKTCSKCRNPCN
ncbi:MAG: hypothetical protein QW304_04855 [Thermoproteota archaeon]